MNYKITLPNSKILIIQVTSASSYEAGYIHLTFRSPVASQMRVKISEMLRRFK